LVPSPDYPRIANIPEVFAQRPAQQLFSLSVACRKKDTRINREVYPRHFAAVRMTGGMSLWGQSHSGINVVARR